MFVKGDSQLFELTDGFVARVAHGHVFIVAADGPA
jgi:hypothetical protein